MSRYRSSISGHRKNTNVSSQLLSFFFPDVLNVRISKFEIDFEICYINPSKYLEP